MVQTRCRPPTRAHGPQPPGLHSSSASCATGPRTTLPAVFRCIDCERCHKLGFGAMDSCLTRFASVQLLRRPSLPPYQPSFPGRLPTVWRVPASRRGRVGSATPSHFTCLRIKWRKYSLAAFGNTLDNNHKTTWRALITRSKTTTARHIITRGCTQHSSYYHITMQRIV